MKLPIVFLVKNMPVDRLLGVPLPMHGELAPLEKQLLPRMPEHEPQKRPHIGELVPIVPRHFFKQASFPMDDFVVRYDQHEIFRKRVHESEGKLVLMEFAVHRVFRKV